MYVVGDCYYYAFYLSQATLPNYNPDHELIGAPQCMLDILPFDIPLPEGCLRTCCVGMIMMTINIELMDIKLWGR